MLHTRVCVLPHTGHTHSVVIVKNQKSAAVSHSVTIMLTSHELLCECEQSFTCEHEHIDELCCLGTCLLAVSAVSYVFDFFLLVTQTQASAGA